MGGGGEGGGDGKQCSHCFTCRTTVWRRDKEGKPLCNACGVYLKMKGRERPIEFRKDKIRRRQYRRVAGVALNETHGGEVAIGEGTM